MFSLKVFITSFLFVAVGIFLTPTALHASKVTYDLTFTQVNSGGTTTYGGSGTAVLDVPGGAHNSVGYQAPFLVDLEFTIDGQSFSMALSQGNSTFGLLDASTGSIWDLTFAETNANGYRLTASNNTYTFFVPPNTTPIDWPTTGIITSVIAPPSTSNPNTPTVPEPSSIALFGTGLFAGAGGLYRRMKAARA